MMAAFWHVNDVSSLNTWNGFRESRWALILVSKSRDFSRHVCSTFMSGWQAGVGN
jgi:hypothetical protein